MPEDIKAKFHAILDIVEHYASKFDAIQSPIDEYQEQEAKINGRIDQLRVEIDSAPVATRWKPIEQAIEEGKGLKELEIRYKERASSYEWHFNETLEKILHSFCREFIAAVGHERIVAATREVTDRDSLLDRDGALELQASAPSLENTAAEQSPTAPLRETGLHEDYVADTQTGKRKSSPIVLSTRGKRQKTGETTRHDAEAEPNALSSTASERWGRPDTRRLRSRLDKSTPDQNFQGITDPSPGKVYIGFRQKSMKRIAVLVLPLHNLQDVGLGGTLDTLGLVKTAPVCYKYDKSTGSLAWRQGYNNGEDQVHRREFPVMYFDGQDIPSKCTFGWTAAYDLRPFDERVHGELVENMSSVRNYLKAHATKSTKKGGRNEPNGAADGLPKVGFWPRRARSPITLGDEDDTGCSATAKTPGRRGHADGSNSSPVPQSQLQSGQFTHQPPQQPTQPARLLFRPLYYPRRSTVSDAPLRRLEPRPLPHAQPSSSPRVSTQPAQPSLEIADEFKSGQQDIEIISISSCGSKGHVSGFLDTTQPSPLAAPTQSAVECQLNLPITCNDHGKPETQKTMRNAAETPSEVSMMAQAALDMTRSPTATERGDLSGIRYGSRVCSDPAYRAGISTSARPPRGTLANILNADNGASEVIQPGSDESSGLDVARRASCNKNLAPQRGMPTPLSSIGRGSFQHNQTLPMLQYGGSRALSSGYSAEIRGPGFSQAMNTPVLVPVSTPTGAMAHRYADEYSQSTIRLDSNGWGYNLPSELIQYLETYASLSDPSLALPRFKNNSGRYICPICSCHRGCEDEGRFADHLMKHWSDWRRNQGEA